MKQLMEGSEAMAEAAIAAGCRFFAGYPMTPFTELLEHFARRLPEEGGVCINAESELEAVGMAWGALATGARAATGSTGQGLSLMQESFSEITLAELPLVIFNMARGQQDYFQSTRGGGHGDYRHIVLAPADLNEAVELTQLAFHLADTWRNPVLVYGDYLTAHIQETVEVGPVDLGPAAREALGARRVARRHRPLPHRLAARLRQGRRPESGGRAAPPPHHRQAARDRGGGDAGGGRSRRRRGDRDRRVRHAGQVRALRRRPAARRRRAHRVRPPDHALAVPGRGGGGGGRRRAARWASSSCARAR